VSQNQERRLQQVAILERATARADLEKRPGNGRNRNGVGPLIGGLLSTLIAPAL